MEFIVQGLGFRDVVIRGISSTKFLAYLDSLALIEEEDLDFLKIGFMEVRKVVNADLIPPRKVWLELRGLPIIGWTEGNLVQLVRKWGSIISFGQILDKGDCYCLPKLQIETDFLSSIEEDVEVLISGKKWPIKIKESYCQEIHYDSLSPPSPIIEMESKGRDLEGDAMDDRASKNSDIASDKISEVNNDERLTPKSDVVGDITVGGTDISEAEVEDSLLNPLTPRTSGHLNQPVSSDHSVEEVQIFQTANWKPREKDSSFSMIQLQSEKEDNDSDYNPLEDLSYICNSH